MEPIRVKKKFHLTNSADKGQSIEVNVEFDAVAPSPTNHALQIWPLLYEWRELPPGLHRDLVAQRLIYTAFNLAACLDRSNQLLATPQAPRLMRTVQDYTALYAQSLSNYQNAPDEAAKKAALDYLLKFGFAVCQAVDQFNIDHAKQDADDAATA